MGAAADLAHHELYQSPELLPCDVIMKGGITSGVVYPLAVCEIATRFKLKSVGGSSAGAIAAAAAAAAEVGRAVPGAGFSRLASLPGELGATTPPSTEAKLSALLKPSETTRMPMDVLHAALAREGLKRRLLAGLSTIVRHQPLRTTIAAIIGVAGLVASVFLALGPAPWEFVVAILLGIVWLVSFVAIGLAITVANGVVDALDGIKANDFGLCSGSDDPTSGDEGLSSWLADVLDTLAGKDPSQGPLTFGDLQDAGVALKVFTTNLTEGTPYTIPFNQPKRVFFVDSELRRSLPDRVVTWMVDHAEPYAGEGSRPGMYRLPGPRDIPVVLAARMSLSFPVLISAVPLYVRGGDEGLPVKSWFSDGGITSNFPIHFFDSPIPRWPTFGITLGRFREGESAGSPEQGIWAPENNGSGFQPPVRDLSSLFGFLAAIADTMQNWLDAAQIRQPGYRDRVVLVKHSNAEGGMNLSMDGGDIENLAERGAAAGRLLRARFGQAEPIPPGPLSWENHRWLRYRSTLSMLEGLARRIPAGWAWPPERNDRSNQELLDAAIGDAPGYGWRGLDQRLRAQRLTAEVLALSGHWDAEPENDRPGEGAPRPKPILRSYPDF